MISSRRNFLKNSSRTALATLATPIFFSNASPLEKSAINLKDDWTSQGKLPYPFHALEPFIDAQTMEIHYSKHHAGYVKNFNTLIQSEKIKFSSEKDFFGQISKFSTGVRNNGGGTWNHNFFWKIMKPKGGGNPTGKLLDAIQGTFGSVDQFKNVFTQSALTRFGSGWAWLVNQNGKLTIGSTPNQDNPLMDLAEIKGKPLLGLDVWEHAYYLKYQNKRNAYIDNWWNTLNWDEVASRLT